MRRAPSLVNPPLPDREAVLKKLHRKNSVSLDVLYSQGFGAEHEREPEQAE